MISAVFLIGCSQKSEPTAASAIASSPASANEVTSDQTILRIDKKEIAKCSAIQDEIQRLSCFDEFASKNGQVAILKDAVITSKGKWEINSKVDPLTDKTINHARLVAESGRSAHGDEIVLLVRCKNGETEAYINWSSYLGSDDIVVTSRIDKAKAQNLSWSISTDHTASFMPQTVKTLKNLIGASSYVVNLTPYNDSPITAIFDVSGAEVAFKDIRQACKW